MTASKNRRLATHVARRIEALAGGYLPHGARTRPTSHTAYAMAVLRRARPDDPGGDLTAWGLVFDGFDADLHNDGPKPSSYERAANAALTLYARHQQSKATPMHRSGVSLGAAVRQLAANGDGTLERAPLRRFQAVITATSPKQRLYHLRTLISLLRANDIPLDYARLATDLCQLDFPGTGRPVELQWARDLHRRTTHTAATSNAATPKEQS